MVNFRTIDDVERDKKIEEGELFKKKISGDIQDVFNDLFPKREKVEKGFSFIKWIGLSLLFLFLATFILGCFWLLKFFITGLF